MVSLNVHIPRLSDGRLDRKRRDCFLKHKSCNNLPKLSFFGVSENVS